MGTSNSTGILEGWSRSVLCTFNERLGVLVFPIMERNRLGELIDLALSNPLIATWKGDSSSIAVKGEGGSERLDENETVRPNPLGLRMSSIDSRSSTDWTPLEICHRSEGPKSC
jgi:hypothetical protein